MPGRFLITKVIQWSLYKLKVRLRMYKRIGEIVVDLTDIGSEAIDRALSVQRIFNSRWLDIASTRYGRFFSERRLLYILFKQERQLGLDLLGHMLRTQKGEKVVFDGPFNSKTVDPVLTAFAPKQLCAFGPVLPIRETNGRYVVLSVEEPWRTDITLVLEVLRAVPLALFTRPQPENIEIKICPQVLLEALIESCAGTREKK